MYLKNIFLIICLSISFTVKNYSQECLPPKIVANNNSSNIFTPEQEMILGNLIFQSMSKEIRLVRSEELLSHINKIGEKLIKHLPNTGIKYKFHLMDIPDVNAYNISGGHIFISRKLIAFAQNEDELAGVIAHELGHATVHHGALDLSDAFKKILNITKLGDQNDITEKYNLLIENARTKPYSRSRGHEDIQQIEADSIGLFAMIAAGYNPNAFTSFYDRMAETEGKTGSWWSDVFGKASPDRKRLREMIQLTQKLPQNCRDRISNSDEMFQNWQADVVTFRETNRTEKLPALIWRKELDSKLRSEIWNLDFSNDGKLLVAQDDFSITILRREPQEVILQIPVESADKAVFTPDNKFLVFVDKNLRLERWDIEKRKPIEIKELVLRRDCWESKLSPDGNFLACIDTKTGKKLFEKKEFYPLNYLEYYSWLDKTGGNDEVRDINFFRIEYSPDSKFVMFSRSSRFRFRYRIDTMTVGESENTALAVNLSNFNPIEVGGNLKKLAARSYLFLDSEKIIGMPSDKPEDAGIFAFPNGKKLTKLNFFAHELGRTSNPAYIVIKPLANARAGIYDIYKGIIASSMNKEDVTLIDNLMVFESISGKIQFREVSYDEKDKNFVGKEVGAIDIPVGSLSNPKSIQISDNFNWLLLSSKTRGGIWNLATNERKSFVRGFRNGLIANDGKGIAEFPKVDEAPHSLVLMNSIDNSFTPILELSEKGTKQFGRYIFTQRSLKEKTTKKKENKFEDEDADLKQNVKFELSDIITNKSIWSQDFQKEAPRYSFDEYSGRLILYWKLGTDVGKAKLKESAELQKKAESLGNKDDDYLIEIVDAYAQKLIGTLLLETGNGSFDVYSGKSEQNWLMLYDSEGRVLTYSINNGNLRNRFFGNFASLSPQGNYIVIENFPGEISLYNLQDNSLKTNFEISGKAVFIQFNLDGTKLFVLSDSQIAYSFDLTKISSIQKSN